MHHMLSRMFTSIIVVDRILVSI